MVEDMLKQCQSSLPASTVLPSVFSDGLVILLPTSVFFFPCVGYQLRYVMLYNLRRPNLLTHVCTWVLNRTHHSTLQPVYVVLMYVLLTFLVTYDIILDFRCSHWVYWNTKLTVLSEWTYILTFRNILWKWNEFLDDVMPICFYTNNLRPASC